MHRHLHHHPGRHRRRRGRQHRRRRRRRPPRPAAPATTTTDDRPRSPRSPTITHRQGGHPRPDRRLDRPGRRRRRDQLHLHVTNTGNVTLTGVDRHRPAGHRQLPGSTAATLDPGRDRRPAPPPTPSPRPTSTPARSTTPPTSTPTAPQGQPATDDRHRRPSSIPQVRHDLASTRRHPRHGVDAPTARADPGDAIDYTFVVTNTGNVTLTDVTVTDPSRSTVSCPADPATLDPGETETCTATYTITQADIDAGEVDNTAAVDATGAPRPARRPTTTTATVTIPQVVTITHRQGRHPRHRPSAAPTGRADAGDAITYTFDVTNTGNVTLTGVTVTDPTGHRRPARPHRRRPSTPGETVTVHRHLHRHPGRHRRRPGRQHRRRRRRPAPKASPPPTTDTDEPSLIPQVVTIASTRQAPSTRRGRLDHPGRRRRHDRLHLRRHQHRQRHPHRRRPSPTRRSTVTCPAVDGDARSRARPSSCTATYTLTQADIDAGRRRQHRRRRRRPAPRASRHRRRHRHDGHASPRPSPSRSTRTAPSTPTSTAPTTGPTPATPISYTFDVTNTGNVTLTDVTVTDPSVADDLPGSHRAARARATVTVHRHPHPHPGRHRHRARRQHRRRPRPRVPGDHARPSTTPSTPTPRPSPSADRRALALDKSSTTARTTTSARSSPTPTRSPTPATSPSAGRSTSRTTRPTDAACTDSTIAPGARSPAPARTPSPRPTSTPGRSPTPRPAPAQFGAETITSNADSVTIHGRPEAGDQPRQDGHPADLQRGRPDPRLHVHRQEHRQRDPRRAGHRRRRQRRRRADATRPATPTQRQARRRRDVDLHRRARVTQDDVDNGSVTNTATGHATFGSTTIDSSPTDRDRPRHPEPGPRPHQGRDRGDVHRPGQTLHYTYILTNAGNVTLDDAPGHRRQRPTPPRPTSRATPTPTTSSTSPRPGPYASTYVTTPRRRLRRLDHEQRRRPRDVPRRPRHQQHRDQDHRRDRGRPRDHQDQLGATGLRRQHRHLHGHDQERRAEHGDQRRRQRPAAGRHGLRLRHRPPRGHATATVTCTIGSDRQERHRDRSPITVHQTQAGIFTQHGDGHGAPRTTRRPRNN